MKGLVQTIALMAAMVALLAFAVPIFAEETPTYVGTETCGECHDQEYENFTKYAKKAHSAHSIKIMKSDLTEEEVKSCYYCHTTGYGKPGGFVSFEETPQLSDAGCEVCHGPGSAHVESEGDPDLIKGDLSLEDCVECHNAERVENFDFKPLLYGGAH